jgi:hypothetical protein
MTGKEPPLPMGGYDFSSTNTTKREEAVLADPNQLVDKAKTNPGVTKSLQN